MNICLSVCVCLSVCLSDLRSAGSADLTSIKNKFGPTYFVLVHLQYRAAMGEGV